MISSAYSGPPISEAISGGGGSVMAGNGSPLSYGRVVAHPVDTALVTGERLARGAGYDATAPATPASSITKSGSRSFRARLMSARGMTLSRYTTMTT